MLSATTRAARQLTRVVGRRSYAAVPNVSKTNELPQQPHHGNEALEESVEKGEQMRTQQAPNRVGVWSRSQNPRAVAMSGPRFEQTLMEFQVRIQSCYSSKVLTNLIYSLNLTRRLI